MNEKRDNQCNREKEIELSKKMVKISETYNLPRLNQEEIESLNRPTTNKEINQ